eukprot:TRINITY_DN2379_c0_g1_i1.p1 TRINITY_DN2379_c0_g1~~TRINITY_DN2379_c0_g1_i1.p1  ORF type:complete len:757 (-),score=151.81 TRINITY_DN2379_c0_g1_i1:45-2291(-)
MEQVQKITKSVPPPPDETRTIECYKIIQQIGKGAHGDVYKGKRIGDGKSVALKKIRPGTKGDEGFPVTAIREIKLLKDLDNDNIIKILEIVTSKGNLTRENGSAIYLIFEFMDHDLSGLLKSFKKGGWLYESEIKCIMVQLLKGVEYLHRNKILHRDIKASNILLNNRGDLKIADFGLARYFEEGQDIRYTNKVITVWYRPPEILLGCENYGAEVDIWSVGCIFGYLLHKQPLFHGKTEDDVLNRIFKILGSPNSIVWPSVEDLPLYEFGKVGKYESQLSRMKTITRWSDGQALDILQGLLSLDPKNRITPNEAINHDYFNHTYPLPCEPIDIRSFNSSHEFIAKQRDMQRKRKKSSSISYEQPILENETPESDYIPPPPPDTPPAEPHISPPIYYESVHNYSPHFSSHSLRTPSPIRTKKYRPPLRTPSPVRKSHTNTRSPSSNLYIARNKSNERLSPDRHREYNRENDQTFKGRVDYSRRESIKNRRSSELYITEEYSDGSKGYKNSSDNYVENDSYGGNRRNLDNNYRNNNYDRYNNYGSSDRNNYGTNYVGTNNNNYRNNNYDRNNNYRNNNYDRNNNYRKNNNDRNNNYDRYNNYDRNNSYGNRNGNNSYRNEENDENRRNGSNNYVHPSFYNGNNGNNGNNGRRFYSKYNRTHRPQGVSSIKVGNIGPITPSRGQIDKDFAACGKVKLVKYHRNREGFKGSMIVQFETGEAAEKAIERLHDTAILGSTNKVQMSYADYDIGE